MTKQISDIREFQSKLAGVPEGHIKKFDIEDAVKLRVRLMDEELRELKEAMAEKNLVECVKEGVDLLYVVLGTFHELGILDDVEYAWDLVHSNNMSKIGPDGVVLKDAGGKIIKPDTYVKLDLRGYFHDIN